MSTVTISPKYQVVIPKDARLKLGLRPGQKVEVLVYDGRVEFIPVRGVRDARGLAHGIDTSVPRERDRV